MSNAHRTNDWTEDELRLGILRLIHSAKSEDCFPGATPRMLMDLGADIKSIEMALFWLSSEDFIHVRERKFHITPKGLDFLGRDDLPPDDSARVPRGPLPNNGQTAIATPIPESDSADDAES